jgi:MoaA/NifB/PqqE/SkfB family radical SAM enzyme
MPGVAVELTNHCNLSCKHCFDKRHSARGYLNIDTLETILYNAKQHGFDYISLTGGEPTLHPEFPKILEMVPSAGYEVGFVTNGWNFIDIYKRMTEALLKVAIITFSLDGAKESTHDALRCRGSFRHVMQAVSICTVKGISFTFNTVITSQNQDEIEALVELSAKLGSRGIRFGYLMPTQRSLAEKLVLDQAQLKETQAVIIKLQEKHELPIILAPGFYTHNLFPCAPLQQTEFNIDWQGNVTLCCHLSGYGDGSSTKDIIGNFNELSFKEANRGLKHIVDQLHKYKNEHHDGPHFKDTDYFPCWYCLNYFEKVNCLKNFTKAERPVNRIRTSP